MKQIKGHRYAICKRCRLLWNIALTQDTSRGYLCPRCRKGGGFGGTTSENSGNAAEDGGNQAETGKEG